MTKRKDRIITFIFVLVIIVLINAIVNQFTPFIDLTKDKVYSLSSGSKSLVKSLKEPLSVKFFLTPNLPPPFSTYEKYIKDLFAEYKSAAGKNISFEICSSQQRNLEQIRFQECWQSRGQGLLRWGYNLSLCLR